MVLRTALMSFLVGGVVSCGFEKPTPDASLPEVTFIAETSLTDESIENTEVHIKLSMKTGVPVTVRFAVSSGTATLDRDVRTTEGEVTFQPFQEKATIVVAVVDDGIEEEEEDVKVTLKSAENAELGDVTDHRLRISANKLPRVRFVAASSMALEAAGSQTFAVELDTLAAEDVVVRYTWTGTAETADHGVTTEGILTIRANLLSQPIPAPITNDATDEDNETIDLSLIAQAGAVVAPGRGGHIHTIEDDDPPPAIGFSLATSNAGEGAGTAQLAVSLAAASEKTITVAYALATGSSATADDYTLTPDTLTFPPGTTTVMVPVTIASDALDEDDETVRVALSNAVNADLTGIREHTLTITDDDATPTLSFQQAASTAAEATATHTVMVVLSAPSGRTVSYSLARSGTSTTADLTLPATPISIPPGTIASSFNVTVINDTIDDDNETAILTLSGLVNATAGTPASHTITIADDDLPTVRFDPGFGDRTEDEFDATDVTYTYRVVLSAPSAVQVTVQVAVGGTAMSNDYDIGGGDIPVVFAPGQTQRDVRVIVRADNQNEANETVTLTLGAATNATNAGDNQLRTHTIRNED